MEKLIKAIVLIAVLTLSVAVFRKVQTTNYKLEFNKIEIKSVNAKLKQLNEDYDKLLHEKKINSSKLKRLENEKQKLKQELRAKKEAQSKIARIVSTPVYAESTSIETMIREAALKYGIDPDYFLRIAICESGLNPNAENRSYYENGYPSGVFQHLSGYWPTRAAQYGWAGASVFNAQANIEVTAQMFRDGASGLWECR